MEKPFKILSIDGGGIRGGFPAMFLANLESHLIGTRKERIYQHFDLICGTSTGGILAIALALGIPAREILHMYLDNAKQVFGKKRSMFSMIFNSTHDRGGLEALIRNKFKESFGGNDPRLMDCKTNICIPAYDLLQGKPIIMKSRYHASFVRDYHIPAYCAALATGAAPVYFDPYSVRYTDLNTIEQCFSNKIDGGVVANNPTLVGIVEAHKAFQQPLSNLKVLSIGTGTQHFSDAESRKNWGLHYWMVKDGKRRLIDLFMQAQSQNVQNIVSMLNSGIAGTGGETFLYKRIDVNLDSTMDIPLDESDKEKLLKLTELATNKFQTDGTSIIGNFCSSGSY